MEQENFKANVSQMLNHFPKMRSLFNVNAKSTYLPTYYDHLSSTLSSPSQHQKRFSYAMATNNISGASKKLLLFCFVCPRARPFWISDSSALYFFRGVLSSQRRICLEEVRAYNRGRTTSTTWQTVFRFLTFLFRNDTHHFYS